MQKLGINLGIELLKITIRRNNAPLQRKDGLDDARNTTGTFKVAYI
jgi:hypothetical protein